MPEDPVTDPQRTLAQLRRIRDYEAFKAFYLQLDPEVTNSPAFLRALMAVNGFDWLLIVFTIDSAPKLSLQTEDNIINRNILELLQAMTNVEFFFE